MIQNTETRILFLPVTVFKTLSNERSEIIKKLQDHEEKTDNPAEKNAELARQLAAIEEKAMTLETDKEEIRKK